MRAAWRWAVSFAAVLLVWEASYRLGLFNPLIFGAPSLIAAAARTDGLVFAGATLLTAEEIAGAILIAWPFGIALGLLVGRSSFLTRVSLPLFSGVIAIPLVVLYPLLVACFGIGAGSKVAFGAVLGLFPIASNAAIGARAVDASYLTAAAAMGATPLQTAMRIVLPFAMPAILNGLRLGTSLVIAGVILAEMLAATDGLGFWISYHRTLFNTGHVYLGILLALALTAVVNRALLKLDRQHDGSVA